MTLPKHLTRARALLAGLPGAVPAADAPPLGFLPSGVLNLDVAMGVPGYPLGRIVIVHGPRAVGKTTLALLACKRAQEARGIAAYLDFERKLSVPYAAQLGVDTRALILKTPRSIEEAFQFVDGAAQKAREQEGDFPIVFVWDSLHAPGGQQAMNKDYTEGTFASEASAYGKGWRKIVPVLADTRCLFFAISQIRVDLSGAWAKEKVGVGNACEFHATVIIDLRPASSRKETGRGRTAEKTRESVRAVIAKNQVGAPFRSTTFDVEYGIGIDTDLALLEAGKSLGVVDDRGGGWFYFTVPGAEGPETVKVQGSGQFRTWADENPLQAAALEQDCARLLRGEEAA